MNEEDHICTIDCKSNSKYKYIDTTGKKCVDSCTYYSVDKLSCAENCDN